MKVHIVSHTHWDREWYRPFQYFRVKLSYFFDKLTSLMESNQDFKCFMLDGQMVMLEDYLNLKPHDKDRIAKLIKDGRLIIGPWYTQPDEFAPDGESLIRNLLVGTNAAKEYGRCMMVGYLPDSFGQSCQMPHILHGSSIDSACVMRGVPLNRIKNNEFIWRGLNGEKVLCVALPKGYSNAMHLPKDSRLTDIRINKLVEELKQTGNEDYVLVMDGMDHQFPNECIADYINSKNDDENEYIHSSLEKYIDYVKKDKDKLSLIDGELIYPVSNRVHTSIVSSRMNQKKMNRQMQNLLVNGVEPLCTVAWLFGCNYPNELINSAWKELLKNQTHDSICGCCTDEVHREIDQRFTDIKNIGTTLKKMHGRAIAKSIAPDGLKLVVYNDTITSGRHIVNAKVYCESDSFLLQSNDGKAVEYVVNNKSKVDAASFSIWTLYLETPCIVNEFDIAFYVDFDCAYGYKTFDIISGEPVGITDKKSVDSRRIENKNYILDVNNDGTFNLFDKELDKMFCNLNTIEDCGDAGDTYNYSPVENDIVITNRSAKNCKVRILEHKLMTEIFIDYELMVPKSLSVDGKTRSEKTVSMQVSTKVTLYESIKRIDIKTKLNNIAKDHRVRAVFPTGIQSDYSYAETQFGTIKRSNAIIDADKWKENGWAEKPLPIYSQQRFVDVNDGEYGLAVLNRGLTEYEIYDKDKSTIAVTLLRGVGYMGKADLAIRPGRPSGVPVKTPNAQCIGEMCAEYSIITHKGNTDDGNIARHAAIYSTAVSSVQNKLEISAIKDKHSDMLQLFDVETLQNQAEAKLNAADRSLELITLKSDKLLVSCIKKAEDENAIVLRVYNPTAITAEPAEIKINAEIEKVKTCDFVEQDGRSINHTNNTFVTEEIKAYSAVTYKIVTG